jgi:hypothetical protein
VHKYLPGFVAMLADGDQVVRLSGPKTRESLAFAPAVRCDQPDPARARSAEGERSGAFSVLQDRERLVAKNVRMPREFKKRHGGVETVKLGLIRLVNGSDCIISRIALVQLLYSGNVSGSVKDTKSPRKMLCCPSEFTKSM